MPPKLEWSTALGRMARTERVEEQGILTWDLVRTAILEGKPEDAIAWLHYLQESEGAVKPAHRPASTGIQSQLAYIAEKYGEEHIEGTLRYWRRKLIDAGNEPTYSLSPLERVQYHTELERADSVTVTLREESDRYVMSADRCAGCIALRGTSVPTTGATKRPYSWSWGAAGVPYFTAHQCIWWEIMAIEDIGYPVRIHEWTDDPGQPCRILFYKNPALIPDEYFARVGAKKDPARFR